MKKFVSYLRLSTKSQTILSLKAQRTIIEDHVKINNGEIVSEYIEIESGKDIKNRPILIEAIEFAKKNNHILVVSKLDRLSRDVEHIFNIKKQLGLLFNSCDLPSYDTLTLSIYAGLAQSERELISIRTKQALQIKKKQGIKLGNINNLTNEGRYAGAIAMSNKAKLNSNNQQAKLLIDEYRKKGMSFEQIATFLNENGFRTAKGKSFKKMTVLRLLNN